MCLKIMKEMKGFEMNFCVVDAFNWNFKLNL